MIMVKPSISAVIAMAIYQKHSVAVNYLNLGYLIIIISIITVPILPRGKYLMNLFLCLVSLIPCYPSSTYSGVLLNILFICLGPN